MAMSVSIRAGLFRQSKALAAMLSESHSASFALIAYASSWLKRHHPDVSGRAPQFAAMGFYAPLRSRMRASMCRCRRLRECSRFDCTLTNSEEDASPSGLASAWCMVCQAMRRPRARGDEPTPRSMISGAAQASLLLTRAARRGRRLPADTETRPARALWAIKALRDERCRSCWPHQPRSKNRPELHEPTVTLRPMTAGSEVVEDYGHVG